MKNLSNTEAELYASVYIPAGNYMFKVNNRNTSRRCEISSNLTVLLVFNIFHTLL